MAAIVQVLELNTIILKGILSVGVVIVVSMQIRIGRYKFPMGKCVNVISVSVLGYVCNLSRASLPKQAGFSLLYDQQWISAIKNGWMDGWKPFGKPLCSVDVVEA